MNYFAILKSLDELLYEVVTWMVFFPVTLWRALRHPLELMDYADTELGDADDEQYTDTLSPPLFLLLSLIASHSLEVALIGENSIIKSTKGLASYISDDTSLILLRIVVFSMFPLAMAVRMIRQKGVRLDHTTLKAPFYSQCYVAAPFALLTGIASLMIAAHSTTVMVAGLIAQILILVWYGTLETLWFSRHLAIGRLRAFGHASVAMVESLVAASAVGWLFI